MTDIPLLSLAIWVPILGGLLVLATGSNSHGQCDVQGWSDVVAVAAGSLHTLGLRDDGTVLAAGCNEFNQCNVDLWSSIG